MALSTVLAWVGHQCGACCAAGGVRRCSCGLCCQLHLQSAVTIALRLVANAIRNVAVWLRPAGGPVLAESSRTCVRTLSLFAISAQVLFVAGWTVGWLLERGYSPVRMYVRELGRRGAAHPWIFEVSIVIWGMGFIALAIAMLPALRVRPWARVAPSLFVLAGIFAMLTAALRLDCPDSVSRVCQARAERRCPLVAPLWPHVGRPGHSNSALAHPLCARSHNLAEPARPTDAPRGRRGGAAPGRGLPCQLRPEWLCRAGAAYAVADRAWLGDSVRRRSDNRGQPRLAVDTAAVQRLQSLYACRACDMTGAGLNDTLGLALSPQARCGLDTPLP